MTEKPLIHVVHIPHSSWEVQRENGETIARYSSEFQAWDAGRAAAESARADLVIHRLDGAPSYESFDAKTGTMQPAEDYGLHGGSASSASGEGRKLILLVEDMVDARELYADYLAYAGFSVVTAINGHEAIGLARMLRPDLILMDIRLPGMDGLEATADIKADPDLAHIPVVAITADPSEDIGARARRAGCAGIITKPVLPDEVARKITNLLAMAQP